MQTRRAVLNLSTKLGFFFRDLGTVVFQYICLQVFYGLRSESRDQKHVASIASGQHH